MFTVVFSEILNQIAILVIRFSEWYEPKTEGVQLLVTVCIF